MAGMGCDVAIWLPPFIGGAGASWCLACRSRGEVVSKSPSGFRCRLVAAVVQNDGSHDEGNWP